MLPHIKNKYVHTIYHIKGDRFARIDANAIADCESERCIITKVYFSNH